MRRVLYLLGFALFAFGFFPVACTKTYTLPPLSSLPSQPTAAVPTATPTHSVTPTPTPTSSFTPTPTATNNITNTPTRTPTLPPGGHNVYYTVTSPNCGSGSVIWQSPTSPMNTYSSFPWTSPTYVFYSGQFVDVTGTGYCYTGFTSVTVNIFVNGSLWKTSTVTSSAAPSAGVNGNLP